MTPLEARVDRVIDGDTIWVRVRFRTRSSAPEPGAAGAEQATSALKKANPRGRKLLIDVLTIDAYGRILGTILR